MDEDLKILTENSEVRLGYLCTRLDRTNEAVNTEIGNLLKYTQNGYKYGNFSDSNRIIKQNCKFCKELLKMELHIVSIIESTLLTLNVGKLLK